MNGNGNGVTTTASYTLSERGQDLGNFLWGVADLLRSDYKPHEYGKVVLPFAVLRRMDCVLEKSKPAVLDVAKKIRDLDNLKADDEIRLKAAAKPYGFFNTSKYDFKRLVDDSTGIRKNLEAYIAGFSKNVRDIFERFEIDKQIAKLDEKNILFEIVTKFAKADLHPETVTNADMGSAFEYLIRKFNELSNETAGDHYTPRDAIRLMVDLLINGDDDLLNNKAPLRMVYDPTAGTGGMLSIAEDRIKAYNKNAKVAAYGQEVNDESYAICKADMLIKGQDVSNIVLGNTLSDPAFEDMTFDYMLSNPPYGVDWKKVQKPVTDEHKNEGMKGRFGPGLPPISDGQMLFLLHLVSKMRPVEKGGSRIGIVMNGSPLFTGGAGSGPSEIRRYLFEHDLVEAIVALPTEMFYNTGIATYIWIITNKKRDDRRGKVQLINAIEFFRKMRKSLGNKRRELSEEDVKRIVQIHGTFEESEYCKILDNEAFGYRTIVVERPLRLSFQVTPERLALLDQEPVLTKNGLNLDRLKSVLITIEPGKVFTDKDAFLTILDSVLKKAKLTPKPPQYKAIWQCLSQRDESAAICITDGKPEPDSELRDTENVTLDDNVDAYFQREVKPYAPDAWIDLAKTRVGYEIPFTRHFYKYVPPRPLHDIDADLREVTSTIMSTIADLAS